MAIKKSRLYLRVFISILLSVIFSKKNFAQQFAFPKEIKFAQYLSDKELYAEALDVLNKVDTQFLSRPQKDSLFYTHGWIAYSSKQLGLASNKLLAVSEAYPLYNKSRFFGAYSLAYTNRLDTAYGIINSMNLNDSVEHEMKAFQLAGISLLKRNLTDYNLKAKQFKFQSYTLQKEENNFVRYDSAIRNYKPRSPLVAGLLSAVIPGAGKFYAGKKKQGIAAFLQITAMGLMALEAYNKGGVKSARFITFGSLFSVFYIGNIWGSVLAVKIKQQEFNREYDNKIMFDMHIPLRSLYN